MMNPSKRPPERKATRIWADGDACSQRCIEALFVAAQRDSVLLTLVSTSARSLPQSAYIRTSTLIGGDISARLGLMASPGDFVVSADAQLLGELQKRGIPVLKPESVKDFPERLDVLLIELRGQLISEELQNAERIRQSKLLLKAKARGQAGRQTAMVE